MLLGFTHASMNDHMPRGMSASIGRTVTVGLKAPSAASTTLAWQSTRAGIAMYGEYGISGASGVHEASNPKPVGASSMIAPVC